MLEIVYRPKAREDLEAIWDYTLETWGLNQAESYLRRIEEALGKLSSNPLLGRKCEEVRQGYRKFHVQRHLIFYRVESKQLEVVRILHQSMDVEEHF